MANTTSTPIRPGAAIPPDDANNKLTVANPEDPKLRHISIAGRHLHDPGDRRGDRRPLLPDRHAGAARRRPAAAPSRLRGDVQLASYLTYRYFEAPAQSLLRSRLLPKRGMAARAIAIAPVNHVRPHQAD